MTPFELMDAMDGMVCLVDTREQDTPRLRARLKEFSKWERQKLNYGDYSAKFPLPDGSWYTLADKVTVERKMSLDELCACFTRERGRFEAEFRRAKQDGAKVYMLIEGASWEKAYEGRYRSRMVAKALVASILAWLARYDCTVLFCEPKTSGRLIRDLLYYEGKERLEGMM